MKNYFVLVFLLTSVYSFAQIKESSAIDSIFTAYNKKDVPGCALGIIKDGQLIYAKGYGLANMEYNIPNAATSVFRIGSTSKQFTAACIVLLAEKNKLSLDDNLKSIFPDFPEYAEKITIKHLLNHTSGIRDYLQISYLKGLGDDDFYKDTHIMKWLINQTDLNFVPGEEFLYSNSGYWLLGQIVNKVAGINMAQFAKKEIFEPLKMNNTHFHNDHTQIVKNRASGYMPDNNENYKISMTTLDMIGDGGIFTSINDIKKWDDAFYESNVLSKAFWNVMTQQGILNNGKEINYAAGLMINTYKGLKTIRHGGAFVGFRAELLRFPEQKLSIAIFANRGDANPSSMANQVADVLLKDKLIEDVSQKAKKVKVDVPKEEFKLSQLVGDYEIQPGIVVRLAIKNDSLSVFQNWNKSTYNIVKVSGNTYQIPKNETISFTFSNIKDNFTETLTVLQGGSKTIAPRKKEIVISGVNLKDYTGSYYSKELDVNYNFKIENEILLVTINDTQATIECTISGLDQFVTELGIIRFQRKEELITSFELDSGRVKNLKFKK
ncbi:serine hydrolase domain-containing protein [Polaribacter sp. Asnod6-C07]|uniref:serine hydrolase domain-containing protein n=1 Tax=Polaribacter sp. Asnod6-C07 TaxID=3160582 RepID=UPI003864772C